MNTGFKFSAKLAPLAVALLLAGCSSGASIADYAWGDSSDSSNPAPAQTKNGLTTAPDTSSYKYTPALPSTTTRTASSSGLSTPPKNSQRVYVVVNDRPITGFDIAQRMRLNKALGRRQLSRKGTVKELINDAVQISELKKNKVSITDRQLDGAIKNMTSSTGSTPAKLKATLRKRGVSFTALKDQIRASLALRYLMQRSGTKVGKVDDATIDRRLRKINSDPRRQAVTVYLLRQVDLPVENINSAMGGQLLQARAVEAQQIAQRYKGCSSLRKAARGIYNVKVSKTIQADGRRLPAKMRKALRSAGQRKLLGPMRAAGGIQMIGFCGTKRIEPPKASRAQVKSMLRAETFETAAERVLRDLRRKAFIDYKVQSVRS